MTFGKHLVLDCTGFNDNMRSKKVIQDFINDLVIYVLKMKKASIFWPASTVQPSPQILLLQ